MNTLDFMCQCGKVSGCIRDISPASGIRFVCHCDDCQISAITLGHPEILDANGGTSAVLLDSSKLVITNGLDQLAAMKMAKIKSRPVLRWYCATCKTPLFNTNDTAHRAFLSFLLANTDTHDRDHLLGPSTGHVWTKFATGNMVGKKRANLLRIVARMFWRQISARITGDYQNTPLFDRNTGLPIVTPTLLSDDDRNAAERKIPNPLG